MTGTVKNLNGKVCENHDRRNFFVSEGVAAWMRGYTAEKERKITSLSLEPVHSVEGL